MPAGKGKDGSSRIHVPAEWVMCFDEVRGEAKSCLIPGVGGDSVLLQFQMRHLKDLARMTETGSEFLQSRKEMADKVLHVYRVLLPWQEYRWGDGLIRSGLPGSRIE